MEVFAAAIEVPLGTLKDWLRVPPAAPNAPAPPLAPSVPAPSESPSAETLHIQTVLEAWPRWEGTFVDFCIHVRRDLHVPFGRMLVAHVLDAHGVRRATRRDGRSSNEIAARGSFVTFFPGA